MYERSCPSGLKVAWNTMALSFVMVSVTELFALIFGCSQFTGSAKHIILEVETQLEAWL